MVSSNLCIRFDSFRGVLLDVGSAVVTRCCLFRLTEFHRTSSHFSFVLCFLTKHKRFHSNGFTCLEHGQVMDRGVNHTLSVSFGSNELAQNHKDLLDS